MKTTCVIIALISLILTSVAQVQSPPSQIDYQGQLLNSIGGPITGTGGPGTTGTATNYEIRFRIWTSQTSILPADLVWAEKQIVTVTETGLFSVRLGEGEVITVAAGDPRPLTGTIPNSATALLNVFNGNERFLGVTVIQPPNTPGEISPRLKFLSAPYAVVAQKARIAEAGPTGGVFSVDQLGIGTTLPNTAVHIKNAGSLNLLLEADSDNVNENDQPRLTFSQDGGAMQTSLGFFNGTDDFGIQTNGTSMFTIQADGDVGIGTAAPAEDFHLVRPDADQARFYATGTSQGGGMYYAGQSTTFGGGFLYEGDSTPASPGNLDRTVFFRRDANVDSEVFSYAYNSNNVFFTGNIGLGTETPTDRLTLASGNIRLDSGDVNLTSGSVRLDNGSVRVPAGESKGFQWFVDGGVFATAAIYHSSAPSSRLVAVTTVNGVFLAQGATSWSAMSDERLKSNITPLTGLLDKIEDIRVVGYNIAAVSSNPDTGKVTIDRNPPLRKTKSGKVIKHEIGTIAQDWAKHFPELVTEPENEDDHYGLSYDRIGVVAIGAIQELNRKVEASEAKVRQRDAKIADLETRLARLEALISRSGDTAPATRTARAAKK